MGTRKQRERQEPLWYRSELPEAPGHPFYRRLNDLLEREGFDRFCEARCREFYHEKLGRPSVAPGIYFRLMPGVKVRLTRRGPTGESARVPPGCTSARAVPASRRARARSRGTGRSGGAGAGSARLGGQAWTTRNCWQPSGALW